MNLRIWSGARYGPAHWSMLSALRSHQKAIKTINQVVGSHQGRLYELETWRNGVAAADMVEHDAAAPLRRYEHHTTVRADGVEVKQLFCTQCGTYVVEGYRAGHDNLHRRLRDLEARETLP